MHFPAVRFIAPYRIYLPDVFFTVRTDNASYKIKALPIIPSQNTSRPHGQNVEVIHDIFGFAGRTMFYIKFEQAIDLTDSTWKTQICSQDRGLVDEAVVVANRLIEVYRDRDINRLGVRSFHVLPLVRTDLSDIRLVVVDDDLNQMPEFAIAWPGFRGTGFGDAVTRDDQVTADIATYLKDNIAIPIHRELMSSARNYLWRGQYRLVPVEANTAFETFIHSALLSLDPNCSLPPTADLFQKVTYLESAIANKTGVPHLQWFDPSVQGWKGLLDSELQRWHANCYLLQNKVIHRGYNFVQSVEAESAIESTVAAMDHIEKIIGN